MLYTYTPESVGGTIIYDLPTGQYDTANIKFEEGKLVAVYERVKDGAITIKVYENTRTTKIISSVELDFKKHVTDNYFFPIEKE
jgi:hypothetical protein